MRAADLIIKTSSGNYSIIVADGALEELPKYLHALHLTGTLWLISDSTVFSYYGHAVEQLLRTGGWNVQCHIVPAGESSKNLEQLSQLYTWMIGNGVERRDCVVALGGGVIGDLAGFAAASVLRGIAYVQIPTTLLAMVDAAIGGKTGINHPLGKNVIGAFHQPRIVIADTQTLGTLPQRELRAGWAEVIKHGVIRDATLFAQLEHWIGTPENSYEGSAKHYAHTSMAELINHAAAIKVSVVNADEHERGERLILNYGHTIGHALEVVTGYGTLLHGEAVAIGMHTEACIAVAYGICSATVVERQQQLLTAYALPTRLPAGIDPEHIMTCIMRDKKVVQKRIHWVLPTDIGTVTVRDDISFELVRTVVYANNNTH